MEFCFESAEAIYLPLFKFLIRLTFAAIFYQGVVEIYLGRVSTEHFSLQHVNITAVFKKGYSSCLWPVCHRKRELYSETFSSVNRYLWSLFSFETMIMLTSRRPPVSHARLMCSCHCKTLRQEPSMGSCLRVFASFKCTPQKQSENREDWKRLFNFYLFKSSEKRKWISALLGPHA